VEEISIGEFARRSRLSLKALRLYDERGVLVPSRVDQASGYRYYDTAQLDEARLVVMLRQPKRHTTRGANQLTTSSTE
jgi:DNA-binding transcriptional MerR regulator